MMNRWDVAGGVLIFQGFIISLVLDLLVHSEWFYMPFVVLGLIGGILAIIKGKSIRV